MTQNKKEKCNHCSKNINIGQIVYECYSCDNVFHHKCSKSCNGEVINDNFYCSQCKENIEMRYNPFKDSQGNDIGNDSEGNDEFIEEISALLEKCKSYSIQELNSIYDDNTTKLGSMLFQNLDGNKSNFDSFSAQLNRLEIKFPIIGLAETNVSVEESVVFQIPGYTPFYQEKAENKLKGSGVCIYISESLNASKNENFSITTENLETLFVTITNGSDSTNVGVIYRPPNGSLVDSFSELNEILEKLPKKYVHIMGDFNIDMHKENSRDVQKLEDSTIGLGFLPLISTYTHEKPGCKKSCIDNIFTNATESTILSGTLKLCISHHLGVFQFFDGMQACNSNSGRKHIQYYDYCNSNIDNFCTKLKNELLIKPPSNFSEFSNIFLSKLDQSCKLDKPKHSKRTPQVNPWITGGLITSIENKEKLFGSWEKAKKKKCDNKFVEKEDRERCNCFSCNDIKEKYVKFSEYRTKLKYLINQRKLRYNSGKIDKCEGDSKKIWEIINNIRGKQRRAIKPNFLINNKRITNRRAIANEFNKYFVSLAPDLNKTYLDENGLRINPMPRFSDYLPEACEQTVELNNCTDTEIENIISELKNNKSSDIPIKVIKSTKEIIAPVLSNLFNSCMTDGYFPNELKTGRISPIYKKENVELLENYRPVSTLPI